ncbi:hypothetical protein EDC96DRAFT_612943 [Choanephora cucurbitarum]|nr:hypothetical protein EDC96DRAFT_612943 [Choanephora cucurbitarum]
MNRNGWGHLYLVAGVKGLKTIRYPARVEVPHRGAGWNPTGSSLVEAKTSAVRTKELKSRRNSGKGQAALFRDSHRLEQPSNQMAGKSKTRKGNLKKKSREGHSSNQMEMDNSPPIVATGERASASLPEAQVGASSGSPLPGSEACIHASGPPRGQASATPARATTSDTAPTAEQSNENQSPAAASHSNASFMEAARRGLEDLSLTDRTMRAGALVASIPDVVEVNVEAFHGAIRRLIDREP